MGCLGSMADMTTYHVAAGEGTDLRYTYVTYVVSGG